MGDVSNKQLISIAQMIMFALAAMFFIGYKLAYDKAIKYANEQISEQVDDFMFRWGLGPDTDLLLGNRVEIPNFGGILDEEQ